MRFPPLRVTACILDSSTWDFYAQTVQNRPLLDFNYGDAVAGQFGLGIQRTTLHRLLSSADAGRNRICGGRDIISLDPEHGYLVEAGDVRHGPFDLIVVADGANSRLRKGISARTRYDRPAHSAALVGLLDGSGWVGG